METIETPHPTVREFILFCAERCGREWLPLYDEMSRVAGRHSFKGLGHAELKGMGFSLGLTEVHKTAEMVMGILSRA
jgi:hypothetical protein